MSDLRLKIAKRMATSIDEGLPPWRKPWSIPGLPCNVYGRTYNGVNRILLMDNDLSEKSKYWGTTVSWAKKLGVCPSENSSPCVITIFKLVPQTDSSGKKKKNKVGQNILFPLMREFSVFNASQMMAPSVDMLLCRQDPVTCSLLQVEPRHGLVTKNDLIHIANKYLLKRDVERLPRKKDDIAKYISDAIAGRLKKYIDSTSNFKFDDAEKIIVNTGAKIKTGNRAAYSKRSDSIILPKRSRFESSAAYYETVFHELAHWSRNGRVESLFDKDVHSYGFEELVAEIASCFIIAEIGVPLADEMIELSRSYVKHWSQSISDNPKFVFDAASQASKVADYLLSFLSNRKIAA